MNSNIFTSKAIVQNLHDATFCTIKPAFTYCMKCVSLMLLLDLYKLSY